MSKPLWNSVLPSKIYVVTDERGTVVCEEQAEFAHIAMKQAKEVHGNRVKTVIEKEQWKRMQALEGKWLKSARRAEA